MNEKNTGLMAIILAVALIILYLALPNLVDWLYGLAVAILLVYGIFKFLRS